jgi:hypothetical protein
MIESQGINLDLRVETLQESLVKVMTPLLGDMLMCIPFIWRGIGFQNSVSMLTIQH